MSNEIVKVDPQQSDTTSFFLQLLDSNTYSLVFLSVNSFKDSKMFENIIYK